MWIHWNGFNYNSAYDLQEKRENWRKAEQEKKHHQTCQKNRLKRKKRKKR